MCLFEDFCLTIKDHQFVSVVGSNGSGKTSMLNIICGNIGVASLLNLQDAKIQVMGGAYGAAREQVEKFLNGQLHFETKESRSQQQSGESNGNVSACGNQCF